MQDKIKEMFNIQKEFTAKFLKEKMNVDINNLTAEEKIYWSKEFILSGSKEMYEMLDEINWKQHRFLNQENNIDNFIEEGIDAFKFLLNLFIINGCSADQFYDKFIDKSSVVDIRYKQESELQFIKQTTDKFVVFDIDGVLNDYPYNFLEFMNDNGYNYYSLSEFRQSNLHVYKGLKKQFRESGQERWCHPNPLAKQFLIDIKTKGYKIILLTARPYKKHSRLFTDTIFWLQQQGLVYDFIFFDEKKEELLINTFRQDQIAFVVDDDIDNVNKLINHFEHVCLIHNPGLFSEDDNKLVKDKVKIYPDLQELYETYINLL